MTTRLALETLAILALHAWLILRYFEEVEDTVDDFGAVLFPDDIPDWATWIGHTGVVALGAAWGALLMWLLQEPVLWGAAVGATVAWIVYAAREVMQRFRRPVDAAMDLLGPTLLTVACWAGWLAT